MAGKGLILSGKEGSWIATASCDVATAGGSTEGGREGRHSEMAGAWVTGLGGNVCLERV